MADVEGMSICRRAANAQAFGLTMSRIGFNSTSAECLHRLIFDASDARQDCL